MRRAALFPIDPETFVPHELHRGKRDWIEANCYVDLWIDVLHTLGFDPYACLAFTLAIDFEGDQWTFFKPPLADLYRLYGIVVEELNIWWDLVEHVYEQIVRGRLVVLEGDSFYLPDTAGTAYRSEHAKTAIAIQALDLDAEWVGYYHGAGYHVVSGEDFRGLFRVGASADAPCLPPYVEIAKLGVQPPVARDALMDEVITLVKSHLSHRPLRNPITAYRARFATDVNWLRTCSPRAVPRYSFATLRQLGASSELSVLFLEWLGARGESALEPIADDFKTIAAGAKALQFKLARAVNSQKRIDFEAVMCDMETAWARAMARLETRYVR